MRRLNLLGLGILFFNGILAIVSLGLSAILTRSFSFFLQNTGNLHIYLLLYMACAFIGFFLFRIKDISWGFASMQDLLQVTKANILINTSFQFGSLLLIYVWKDVALFPVIITLANFFILQLFLGAPPFLYRHFIQSRHAQRYDQVGILVGSHTSVDLFIRYNQTAEFRYKIEGIIASHKKGRKTIHKLHGHKIISYLDDISPKDKFFRDINEKVHIIITDPKLVGTRLYKLYKIAKKHNLEVLRVSDFQPHKSHHLMLRPINIEDLLGRLPIYIEYKLSRAFIKDKCILITGAGGSIGSEIVRQLLTLGPRKLILFDNSEYFLYMIDQELRNMNINTEWETIVGSVTQKKDLEQVMKYHTPHIVFHAAALKHVPLSEINAHAAIETNLGGTMTLANLCLKYHVESMVLISTDKAVNPTNVMGLSKRLAEIYCQSLDSTPNTITRFISVRFGNVLGSTGSVIPLFQSQISKGGPVTVTHADMERYFMTIQEAVMLVLQAGAYGAQDPKYRGGIFVLDMGVPVNILSMAEKMISLSGFTPYKDIQINITGIRPGEKMSEELVYEEETFHKNIIDGVHFVEPQGSPENLKKLETLYRAATNFSLDADALAAEGYALIRPTHNVTPIRSHPRQRRK